MNKRSPRTDGMVNASADYYQENDVFRDIQNAQALEYDRIEENNKDLALQLSPATATWGLVYYEEALRLPMKDNTDYEARRPAVLAKLLKSENFSAKLIENLVYAYGKRCVVTIDISNYLVNIAFIGGIPVLFEELQTAINNIIHAHLCPEYGLICTHEQLHDCTHRQLTTFTQGSLSNKKRGITK